MTRTAEIVQLDERRTRVAEDSGYIKLWRTTQECAFKRDPERFALWIHMLLEASHAPFKTILGGSTITLQSGQFVSGNRDLEIATGVSIQRIKTSIKFFEQEGMISRSVGRHGTVFTVLNYTEYQAKKGQKSNPPATHQINPPTNLPINPPKASTGAASDESATRQSTRTATHQQPTQLTRIQEDKIKEKDKKKDIVGKPDQAAIFERVISHLNTVTGKAFKNVKSHQKFISARLGEGHSESDLITVIDRKVSEWLTDPRMNEYLRPSTLFNSEKFDGYLNSTPVPQGNRRPVTDFAQVDYASGAEGFEHV